MRTPKAIVMMEDHDKAYHAWKEHGVSGRTLVHVDAHIDFGWIPEMDLQDIGPDAVSIDTLFKDRPLLNPFAKPRSKMMNIGNYICPAMREGMVDVFYWVVPDESFRLSCGKRHIIRQLNRLLKIKKYAGSAPVVCADSIRCRILGRELTVCPLASLPCIDSPVLLDIDVDFMITPSIWNDLDPGRWPWIFPEDLYARLVPHVSEVDVLTIAYSVEGGFTPLKFKYFGDELRCLFTGGAMAAARYKREALHCEMAHRYDDAAAAYERAVHADPEDASVYFNLALLHANKAPCSDERASFYYQEAVRRDRTYATRYNNYGIIDLQRGRPRLAESEFSKALRWDTDNVAALSGLGYALLASKRYDRAADLFRQCLARDARNTEARFGSAVVDFRKNRLDDAHASFSGIKNDEPDDADPYWWLGRIAQRRGDLLSAISCYKDAVMRGREEPFMHARLAYLYMRKRSYFRAFEELKRSWDVWRALS